MKLSILLPYKENFSSDYAGAVSLLLKETIPLSSFKKNIKIYGSTLYKKDILKNKYVNLSLKKFFFQSSSNIYVNNFLKKEKENKSVLIEVHNRPNYINQIRKINPNIVLYFHNNPLEMKGSKKINERISLLNKTKKIIFISKWLKNQFFKGINKRDYNKKCIIIPHATDKKKINFKNKENLIIFVGRLNKSKGYDLFGKAIENILKKNPNWKGIVIGDEPREAYNFKHNNLKILGFRKHHQVIKWFKKSEICVVCSRWEEPFGRTALEASSSGCAVIISNKGGLPEASPKAIKLNKLTSNSLENLILKLINNKNLRKSLQKKIYKHFYLTNNFISNKIDSYREKLILDLL